MTNLTKELAEIGDLITSTMFITAVRREVSKVRRDGFVVTDGKRVGSSCDVVVKSKDDMDNIARRIREGMPDARIKRIALGVLGVSEAPRGSELHGRLEFNDG